MTCSARTHNIPLEYPAIVVVKRAWMIEVGVCRNEFVVGVKDDGGGGGVVGGGEVLVEF